MVGNMNKREEFDILINKKDLKEEELWNFFDTLEEADINMMQGSWIGGQIYAGNHPLADLFDIVGWRGKEFVDENNVHPLVFNGRKGDIFKVNPDIVPYVFPYKLIPNLFLKLFVFLAKPLISTKKSKAVIRMIEDRGVITCAMMYDNKQIIDIFRKVDNNTVMGYMYIKNLNSDTFFFSLCRENVEDNK